MVAATFVDGVSVTPCIVVVRRGETVSWAKGAAFWNVEYADTIKYHHDRPCYGAHVCWNVIVRAFREWIFVYVLRTNSCKYLVDEFMYLMTLMMMMMTMHLCFI